MEQPWHYWTKNSLGQIYFSMKEVDTSEKYFRSAVQYCPTFTIAHIGVCDCSVVKRNFTQGKCSYETARELNPVIVKWETFEEYLKSNWKIDSTPQQEDREMIKLLTGVKMMSASNKGSQGNEAGGSTRRGGGGMGGNGTGDGNGSDDDSGESVWDKFKETKPTTRKCVNTGRTFRQVGNSSFWLSRDKARHGGSFFKLFIEKGNTLDFVGSVPITIFKEDIYRNSQLLGSILEKGAEREHFGLITKRESNTGEKVKKKDIPIVHTKPKKRE